MGKGRPGARQPAVNSAAGSQVGDDTKTEEHEEPVILLLDEYDDD